MKVYFLGMIMSGAPNKEVKEITNLIKLFQYEVGGMEFVGKSLIDLHQEKNDPKVIWNVWNNLELAIKDIEDMPLPNPNEATLYSLKSIRDSILKVVDVNPETMTNTQLLKIRPVMLKIMRYKRQLYWLAWLEDFYCRKIEDAYKRGVGRTGWFTKNLFVAALPEFSLMDIPFFLTENIGFYKPIVEQFLNGTLPPPPCRMRRETMLTFCELTRRYSTGNSRLLIVPGTIIWKEPMPHATYYNTAPVFWEGKCIHVWDKQLISNLDGICLVQKRRHVEPKEGMKIASTLTQDFMYSKTPFRTSISPVFEISVFSGKVTFGLSICVDAARPDFFESNSPADIQLYLADGGNIKEMTVYTTSYLKASKAVFYCDVNPAWMGDWKYPLTFVYKIEPGVIESDASVSSKIQSAVDLEPRIITEFQKEIFMILSTEVIDI